MQATVVAATPRGFVLDRSLFAPRSTLYRHAQPADRGTVWDASGAKRPLAGVDDERGVVVHRVEGWSPRVGEKLRLDLDVARRESTERAHTALHLVLHAVSTMKGLRLGASPEVKGDGHVRVSFAPPAPSPPVAQELMKRALGLAQKDAPVVRRAVPRDRASLELAPQPYADGVLLPGPGDLLDAVFIEGVGGLPCDGTLAARAAAAAGMEQVSYRVGPDGAGLFLLRA